MGFLKYFSRLRSYSILPRLGSSVVSAVVLLVFSLSLTPLQPCFGVTSQRPSQEQSPESLILNGGFQVGLQCGRGDSLCFRNEEAFIPASTMKVLTSLLALQTLGREFRFSTTFYLDSSTTTGRHKEGTLYIKGGGDPWLTSENIAVICTALAIRGISRVNSIVLDDSWFQGNPFPEGAALPPWAVPTGSNPPIEEPLEFLKAYNAPNGGLAVNFNGLPFVISEKGTTTSAEPQTPLLPVMPQAAQALQLKAGHYRLNIAAAETSSSTARALPPSLRYVGELFQVLLGQAGIATGNSGNGGNGTAAGQVSIRTGHVPSHLSPIYRYTSDKTLAEVVQACLHYSNNFVANQLFLASGARVFGLPATWQKSQKLMRAFCQKRLKLTDRQCIVREGSGLSRHNRLSASALITILDQFRPYADLLKKRGENILLKSGTMDGIYCYSGFFIQDKNRRQEPFALLLNQPVNNRNAVLQALYRTSNPKP